MVIMPFEMICGRCGNVLYWGLDVKSPRDVLKQDGFRCRNCGVKLSEEFDVEVSPAGSLIDYVATSRIPAIKIQTESVE